LRNDPFFLPDDIATTFVRQFEAHWKLMLIDLHYAGALLNPFMTDVTSLHKDGIAKRALNKVIQKISASLGLSANKVMTQFTEFV